MPWLQFFNEYDRVIREFKTSQQCQLGITPDGGIMMSDAANTDSETAPRILVLPGTFKYSYAKTISDQVHDGVILEPGKAPKPRPLPTPPGTGQDPTGPDPL